MNSDVVLRPGDELVEPGLPAHKRVFVGPIGLSGEDVVDPAKAQPARLIRLDAIPNWQQLRVGERGPEDVFQQIQAQQRARKVVTERVVNRTLGPNCEHVCSYIRKGEAESPQLRLWGGLAAAAALAVMFFRRA